MQAYTTLVHTGVPREFAAARTTGTPGPYNRRIRLNVDVSFGVMIMREKRLRADSYAARTSRCPGASRPRGARPQRRGRLSWQG